MMMAKLFDPGERRRHPRFRSELMVNVEAQSTSTLSSLEWSTLAGVTKDVSRGGMLLSLDAEVEVGSACVVRFFVPVQQIFPPIISGTVLRARPRPSGCEIAVEFTSSLAVLELSSKSV